MGMSSTSKWIVGIIAGVFLLLASVFLLFLFSLVLTPDEDALPSSGERVAIVEVKETILSSDDVVRQIKKYRESSGVKAIVLRIESPGGGVAASQEIFEEVKKARDGGKPVVASMGSVAASGGYYIACGADRIIANPGTLTGSIGVIFQFVHISELLQKIGVDATTYKTGKFKDSGSPFRKPTSDESRYFDQLLADVYDQFVDVVARERKLDRKHVLKYADGRVFTGRQGYELGFVDTLGTYEDAIALAADLAGITGKPKIVKERKKESLLDRLLGVAAGDLRALRDEVLYQPFVQYKYNPPY